MHAKDLKHRPSARIALFPYDERRIWQLVIGLLALLFYAIPFSFSKENVLQMFERDFQKIVASAQPAVVKVVATQVNSVPFQPNLKRSSLIRQDIGSGILIDTAGHVATTIFEIEAPNKLEVVFSNGEIYSAKLIGTDTLTDIAIIRAVDPGPGSTSSKVPKTMQPGIKWGDSSKINTGSWAVTIGSSYGHSPIISFGIVAGWDILPDQLCAELIKINAAVTPGNSGGAVVNTSGEIIGMILAVMTEPIRTDALANMLFEEQDNIDITQFLVQPSPLRIRNQEITFAMPIETVHTVAKEIIVHGRVARGWLGVEVDIGTWGLYVTHVIEDSPAYKGGLLPNDVILEFDKTSVRSYADLLRCVATKRPQTKVKLKISRNGAERHHVVTLGEKH